ncbi:septum formation inhibitor Maf [Kocuria tytonicola]|uniref:Nucleoside triphosphate pyrophosphatase n=1 Tax=Kocuria tytonicola TaxID=2055946 RepID=A0A3L9L156_9MICC|nr:nucleoside triphosphate pyrophosphatase [Kocuria tytonicola]RLY92291.1 septum formation inhibitor Maf [Kocuria tytonicola]
MEPSLVLASQSPARAGLLQKACIPFDTVVSHVDEDAVVAAEGPLSPPDTALRLARAKAEAVAALPGGFGRLVLGCDSVFELDGRCYGKPHDPAVAVERIGAMSGRVGTLHTGHWLVDARRVPALGEGSIRSAHVHFAPLSAQEIRDYVATGEPLEVAGSFTLDGRGSLFIERVDGDPNAVIGLSLTAVRELLRAVGVSMTSWWDATAQRSPS